MERYDCLLMLLGEDDADRCHKQEKTITVPEDALASGNDPALPPLMNPTMLEASDDLTNLSHLNEPAGMSDRANTRMSKLLLTLTA
jgi:myosin heavy subunit